MIIPKIRNTVQSRGFSSQGNTAFLNNVPQFRDPTRPADFSGLVRVGSQLSRLSAEMKQKADETAIIGAQNQLDQLETGLFYDPENGAFSQRGANALNIGQSYGEEYLNKAKEIRETLGNDDQRLAFDKMFSRRYTTATRQLNTHERRERDAYSQKVQEDGIDLAVNRAAVNYNDPNIVAQEIERAQGIIRAQGARLGVPVEKELQAVEGQVHKGAIMSMVSNSDPDTVMRGLTRYEALKEQGVFKNAKDIFDIEQQIDEAYPSAAAALELREFSPFPSQANSAIDFVITQLEGGDAIADEPGGGVARFGISSSVEGSERSGLSADEVRGLDRGRAGEIAQRYWDDNNIDDLPPQVRLIAFDMFFNGFDPKVLGMSAQEAIEDAAGDPNRLMATRLRYYEKLAEVNPALAENLPGWRNRLQKITRAFGSAGYDRMEIAERAAQFSDPRIAEEFLKQAEQQNIQHEIAKMRNEQSVLSLIDDPELDAKEKRIQINRLELEDQIGQEFASDARRLVKTLSEGEDQDIPEDRKLSAFEALTVDLEQLRAKYADDGEFETPNITTELIDDYKAYQQKVYSMVGKELTRSEAKGFLEDFTAGLNQSILNNDSTGGSIAPGIQDPYNRAFKAIDAYLEAEGRDGDLAAKRDLVFNFRKFLGRFTDAGYEITGEYESTGSFTKDERVVLQALDLAKRELARNEYPILDTIGGTPNAAILDGQKVSVSDMPSNLEPAAGVQTDYTVKTGADGRRYKIFSDGTYEVIR